MTLRILLGLVASIVAGLVIGAVVRRWEDRPEKDVDRTFQRAATDDHRCDLCESVVVVRELVALHDDYALCCVPCAEVLKVRRMARGEA